MSKCRSTFHTEACYSLVLAILSPTFLAPEQAFAIMDKGYKSTKSWQEIAPEISIMRGKGIPWKDIAETFGYSVNTAMQMLSRWSNNKIAVTASGVRQRKDITNNDIVDMSKMKETMTYKEIGDIYGMKPDAIYARIKRFKAVV